ncbi:hypothetical protein CLG96_16570 [Sphingomonas oleivorans]|uniref:TonB-dependent receptor n=1 Tax=Sphingomonas oleivorans TaxID=1735121 RepID=A0A2T5FU06_9SPHN|nr:TonB-dependent receptor [Sphingomonas oleivorans]PTQ07766.1 hypothetical protein CLG96_16570 [Sphingomonas oleivorans]
MRVISKSFSLLLMSGGSFLAAAPALAQATGSAPVLLAAADAAANAPTESDGDTAGIVVVGRTLEAQTQKTPVSITSFGAEDLRTKNISEPQDLNRTVPGLSISEIGTTRNSARYSLRGQSQETGADPSVMTYFGGVATASPGPGFLFDLSGVDVFKGPQGTAFGRNTTGGAVVLTPEAPTDEFGGYVDASVGGYDFQRIQAAVNVPIAGDALSARFAIDANHRRGFTRDVKTGKWYDGRDYKAYRGYIVAKPFEGFENRLLINFAYGKASDPGASVVAVDPTGIGAKIFPGLPQALIDQQKRGVRRVDHDVDNGFSSFRSLAVSNVSSYQITPTITIKNIFGYNDNRVANYDDTDGSPFPILGYLPTKYPASYPEPDSPYKSVSDEIQLSGDSLDGKLQWNGGVYYEHHYPVSSNQQDRFYVFGNLRFSQALTRTWSRAVYAQASYEILPGLKLTGGGRYTWDRRKQTTTAYALATPCYTPASVPGNLCGVKQKANFSAPTWNASLQYEIANLGMVYATVRRGYKSGGFNNSAPTPDMLTYRPEYVTDYEIGGKTHFDLLGQPAHLNIDLYKSDFTSKQTTGTVIANGQSYGLITNAGTGSIKGVEVDTAIELFRKLTLSALYAYTDAKSDSLVFNGILRPGAPLAGVSKHKLSATAQYAVLNSDDIGDVSATLSYSYQSAFQTNTSLDILTSKDPFKRRTPGYGLLDARVDWNNFLGRPIDLAVYVTNVTDKAAMQQLNSIYDGLGYNTAMYVPPRMVAASLRYRFK